MEETAAPTTDVQTAPSFVQTAPSIPEDPVVPPPPAKRRGPRTLVIASVIAVIALLALGGGAAFANASLSSQYGASRAVTDYLAAQSRGDVAYMLANANYPKDDGEVNAHFGSASLTAMMSLAQNRSIARVTVTKVEQLNSTTSVVTVSMTWGGTSLTQPYTLHKDPARKHYVLYNSWLIDIPSSTIKVALPPQPGGVGVDGLYGTPASSVSVIQGFHTISMHQTDFYDEQSQVVDATDDAGVATFNPGLSAEAVAAAADEIRSAFKPSSINCDARQNFDCPNHTYAPAPGTYAILELPGGNVNAYRSWVFTIDSDPTTGMKLEVGDSDGKIAASGTCTMLLVVDGGKKYHYRGTWHGTLTWTNGGFAYEGTLFCDQSRA